MNVRNLFLGFVGVTAICANSAFVWADCNDQARKINMSAGVDPKSVTTLPCEIEIDANVVKALGLNLGASGKFKTSCVSSETEYAHTLYGCGDPSKGNYCAESKYEADVTVKSGGQCQIIITSVEQFKNGQFCVKPTGTPHKESYAGSGTCKK